jgi:hypothetical protein
MKAGDLVIMPGETLAKVSGKHSIGLVIEDDVRFPGGNKRIGVWWSDGDRVDYEPRDWLEVVSESR